MQRRFRADSEALPCWSRGFAPHAGCVPNPGSALRRTDGSPLRALVVDDEPDLVEVLTRMLSYEGWIARGAHDGAESVRIGGDFDPDAVILDVNLPDITGFDVLRRLRAINP